MASACEQLCPTREGRRDGWRDDVTFSVKLRDHEKPRAAWHTVENKAVEPREEITEDHVGSEASMRA